MKNQSLIALVVAGLFFVTPVKAAEDRDFIMTAALLATADQWCEETYKVDLKVMGVILSERKINLTKGVHKKMFSDYLDLARAVLRKGGVNFFCDQVYSDFGNAEFPLIIKR